MRLDLQTIARTAVIAALAIAFQALNLRQPITGPGINAILYVASIYIGPVSGLMVGLLTPWVALLTGIMRLAPAVPVVMAGNAVLALVSGYVARFNRYLGMGLGAVCKYAAMTLGIKYLIARGNPHSCSCLCFVDHNPTYYRHYRCHIGFSYIGRAWEVWNKGA